MTRDLAALVAIVAAIAAMMMSETEPAHRLWVPPDGPSHIAPMGPPDPNSPYPQNWSAP